MKQLFEMNEEGKRTVAVDRRLLVEGRNLSLGHLEPRALDCAPQDKQVLLDAFEAEIGSDPDIFPRQALEVISVQRVRVQFVHALRANPDVYLLLDAAEVGYDDVVATVDDILGEFVQRGEQPASVRAIAAARARLAQRPCDLRAARMLCDGLHHPEYRTRRFAAASWAQVARYGLLCEAQELLRSMVPSLLKDDPEIIDDAFKGLMRVAPHEAQTCLKLELRRGVEDDGSLPRLVRHLTRAEAVVFASLHEDLEHWLRRHPAHYYAIWLMYQCWPLFEEALRREVASAALDDANPGRRYRATELLMSFGCDWGRELLEQALDEEPDPWLAAVMKQALASMTGA